MIVEIASGILHNVPDDMKIALKAMLKFLHA